MKSRRILLFTLLLALVSPSLSAQEVRESNDDDRWRLGVGARIGGYGFREVQGDSVTWEDCRMNGTGVFLTLDANKHLFGEVGFDLYHATGPTVASGMDRISFHNQYALGVRFLPDFFVTPYVQVGGGPEITHIEVDGAEKTAVLPSGFMGLGGEINIGDLKLGMHFRALMMSHPVHSHGTDGVYQLGLEPEAGGSHGESVAAEVQTDWEVAGQAQFWVRYVF